MPTKKQKLVKKRNQSILIVSMCVLSLILVGVVTYQWILNKSDISKDYNLSAQSVISNWFGNRQTLDQKTNNTPVEIEQIPVDDKITYTIPSGWTKENGLAYSNSEADVVLKSPNYQIDDMGVGTSQGMSIFLSASPLENNKTLKTEKSGLKEQYPAFSDISDTKVAGIDAIKYHNDGEGQIHSLIYFVIYRDHSLLVVISTKNLATEESYQNQINSFINSIRFR
jgi:hypothetical protein